MRLPKKVYLSGAIEHYDITERRQAFSAAATQWEEQGCEVFNPFNNGLPPEAHWREHMRADIAQLLRCDAIYMLRGWELSKGAKLELDVASSCGIEVIIEVTQEQMDAMMEQMEKKAANKREQNGAGSSSAEREQARPKVKAASKREQNGTRLGSAEREQARPEVKHKEGGL